MGRLLRILALYYAIWQTGHFLVNAYGLWIDRAFLESFLGGSMGQEQFQALLMSGWADLLFVSPLGIAAGSAYGVREERAAPFLLISVWTALYSAYAYGYLHSSFGTFPNGIWNLLLVWGAFLPILLLGLLLPFHLASNAERAKA